MGMKNAGKTQDAVGEHAGAYHAILRPVVACTQLLDVGDDNTT
eukprot:NODE_13629_length_189_cov_82.192857_g13014_i0.p2 GENE.NODE_13629_length_189_cov_82.192857_g13014_i0~~NODE_13629_length_189_cov_82.192857_g13014_i0.p2  ORF type:complete len:51 (-),score=20.62 NODE_13629_length_189_cov_82.192857_g13014_i0:35-163(-)